MLGALAVARHNRSAPGVGVTAAASRSSTFFHQKGPTREPLVSLFLERVAGRHRALPCQQSRPYAADSGIVRHAYRQARAAVAALSRGAASRHRVSAAVVFSQALDRAHRRLVRLVLGAP